MGNYDKSIDDYRHILEYNPFDIESAGLLAECKYLKGDTLGAYNLLNQTYYSLHYLSETGFYILGSIKLFNKMYESAIEDFSAIILLNPFNIEAIIYRALAYYSLEDYVKSRNDLNAAIRLNKDEITALYTRGLVNIKLGNLKEAHNDLERAVLLGHPRARAAINKYLDSY
jgi:tetratricopeptide (TPR) repeat protein